MKTNNYYNYRKNHESVSFCLASFIIHFHHPLATYYIIVSYLLSVTNASVSLILLLSIVCLLGSAAVLFCSYLVLNV